MWEFLKMHRTICQVVIEQFDANQQSCVKLTGQRMALHGHPEQRSKGTARDETYCQYCLEYCHPSRQIRAKKKQKKTQNTTQITRVEPWIQQTCFHQTFTGRGLTRITHGNATAVSIFSCTGVARHRAPGYSPVWWSACRLSYFPRACWWNRSSSRFMTPDTQSDS